MTHALRGPVTAGQALVMYVFVVIVGVVGGHALTKAEHQAERNCKAQVAGARAFNATLDALLENSISSKALSPAEKLKRLEQYTNLHLTVVQCPKLGIW